MAGGGHIERGPLCLKAALASFLLTMMKAGGHFEKLQVSEEESYSPLKLLENVPLAYGAFTHIHTNSYASTVLAENFSFFSKKLKLGLWIFLLLFSGHFQF